VPGARLPHVWLTKDRANYSSLDLVGHGRFTVITGIGGDAWVTAAGALAADGLPVAAVTVGPGCQYEDPFGDWARASEIEDNGALLVRPDEVVAWRAKGAAKNAAAELGGALRRILGV
jgi:2,4-dichlorophenol 6-monooxygenase